MRVALAVAPLLVAASTIGCKPKAGPCMAMGGSELIAHAAVVRLDVYPPTAHCDGSRLADGAPAPTQTQVAAAGTSIHLDVPAGKHVLLLSAYADASAAQLIGTACTETTLKADTPACFNLTLAPTPDASVGGDFGTGGNACSPNPDDCPAGSWCGPDGQCAPGCRSNADCAPTPDTPFCVAADHRCVQCLSGSDCAPGKRCSPAGSCVDGCDPQAGSSCPSTLMCCSNLCLDSANGDILNCGGCGRACLTDAAHGVAAANCSASLCKPSCLGGFADCTEPPAPQPDDGCETNIHDPSHCGGCTNVCTLDHVQTATCPTGTCAIGACSAGWSDCDGKPANGCECADIAGDPNHGCCPASGSNPGGCAYQHSDGFGHNFIDCYTLGTYNTNTAQDAAKAFNAAGTVNSFNCAVVGGQESVWCNATTAACACFAYFDTVGGTYVGKARKTVQGDMATAKCTCPLNDGQDVSWK